ncbi:hypothetical protein DL95DRAFT_409649 [Leptodontidium sp. 2 PMI_412]|nr:hypothetical protein DL95DRAFT_409649 [Leptodontidium sp. 2 PMI_412]
MPVSKVRHNKKQSKNQPSSLGLREKRRRDEMVDIVQRMYRCGCMEGLVSPGNTELSTPSSSRHAPRHKKKRNREKSEEKETEKDRMVKLKLKIPHVGERRKENKRQSQRKEEKTNDYTTRRPADQTRQTDSDMSVSPRPNYPDSPVFVSLKLSVGAFGGVGVMYRARFLLAAGIW